MFDDNTLFNIYLLEKPGKIPMTVTRLRTLRIEIYKTINRLNPSLVSDIFKVKMYQRFPMDKFKLNLDILRQN